MASVVVSSAAAEEFAEALFWYSQRSLQVANELDQEVDDAIRTIAAVPERYPIFDDRHRFYRLRRFPYLILYRVESNVLVVVAIAHTARKPEYWRGR